MTLHFKDKHSDINENTTNFKLTKSGKIEIIYDNLSDENHKKRNSHFIDITYKNETKRAFLFSEDIGNTLNIQYFLEQLFEEENIQYSLKFEDEKNIINKKVIVSYKLLSNKINNVLKKLKDIYKVKNLNLRFKNLMSYTGSSLEVEFYGHGVSGSYVYAEQVIPNYIKQLTILTNREVLSTGHRKDNQYSFNILLDNVVDVVEEETEFKKIIEFDSECAFEYQGGEIWSTLYIMLRNIKENVEENKIYKKLGIKLKNDFLFFDDIKIAKVLKYRKEETNNYRGHNSHCIRTKYCAKFDFFIEKEKEYFDLYFEKYKQIVNYHFDNENIEIQAINVGFDHTRDCGQRIRVYFENKTSYSIGSNFYVFNKTDVYDYINTQKDNVSEFNHSNVFSNNINEELIIEEKNKNNLIKFFKNEIKEDIYKNNRKKYNNYHYDEEDDRNKSLNIDKIDLETLKNINFQFFNQNKIKLNAKIEEKIILNMINYNEINWMKELINSGYNTQKSALNIKKINNGFSRADFLIHFKSEEMFKLLSDWIIEEFNDKFFNIINFDNFKDDKFYELKTLMEDWNDKKYNGNFIEKTHADEKYKKYKNEFEEHNNNILPKIRKEIKIKYYTNLKNSDFDFVKHDCDFIKQDKFNVRRMLLNEIFDLSDDDLIKHYFFKLKKEDIPTLMSSYEWFDHIFDGIMDNNLKPSTIHYIGKILDLDDTQKANFMFMSGTDMREIYKECPNLELNKIPFKDSLFRDSYDRLTLNQRWYLNKLVKEISSITEATTKMKSLFGYYNRIEYHDYHNCLFIDYALCDAFPNSESTAFLHFNKEKNKCRISKEYFRKIIDITNAELPQYMFKSDRDLKLEEIDEKMKKLQKEKEFIS